MLTQNLPSTARNHSTEQRREIMAATAAVKRQFKRMGSDFDRSWDRIAPTVVAIVSEAQRRVIANSDAYIPAVLEETGQTAAIPARAQVRSGQLIGITGAGISTRQALDAAPIRAKQARQSRVIRDGDVTTLLPGKTETQSLRSAEMWLTASVGTILSDTSRAAESLGMFVRPVSGYARMLTPPSCGRCVILAGKIYRKNADFPRHPGCDCGQIPASESLAGDLTVDPQAYFDSLDKAGQAKLAGSLPNAQAVRDGADISQVVNAYRKTAGMQVAQKSPIKLDRLGNKFTTEGTTKRGLAGKAQKALRKNGPSQVRLMPESIYRRAKDQADADRLLRLYGWIL